MKRKFKEWCIRNISIDDLFLVQTICRNDNPVLLSFMTNHRICNTSNTTGVTSGSGTVYHVSLEYHVASRFQWDLCCLILIFLCSILPNVVFILVPLFIWSFSVYFFNLLILIIFKVYLLKLWDMKHFLVNCNIMQYIYI